MFLLEELGQEALFDVTILLLVFCTPKWGIRET